MSSTNTWYFLSRRTNFPLDLEIEGRFKLIETETEMTEVMAPDPDDDGFFHVLGGTRVKLTLQDRPAVAGRVREYEWSSPGGSFFRGYESDADPQTPLMAADLKEVFWEGIATIEALNLYEPEANVSGFGRLQVCADSKSRWPDKPRF